MAKGSVQLFKGGPLRQLKRGATKSGGRNNLGRITAFHRGGGAKRAHRSIDMARREPALVGTVERLEYDPFRNSPLALVRWEGRHQTQTQPRDKTNSTKSAPRSDGGRFPKGIHEVPRRELRKIVATICGVPLSGGRGSPKVPCGPKVVRVDGSKRSFSSSSASGGADRGIGILLSREGDQMTSVEMTKVSRQQFIANHTLQKYSSSASSCQPVAGPTQTSAQQGLRSGEISVLNYQKFSSPSKGSTKFLPYIFRWIEEIILDYIHHEITRSMVMLYLRLFLTIAVKDVILGCYDLLTANCPGV